MLLVLVTLWEELFEKPAKEHLTGSFSTDHIDGFRAKVLLGYFSEPEIFWEKVQGWTSHGEGGIIFFPIQPPEVKWRAEFRVTLQDIGVQVSEEGVFLNIFSR